MVLIALCCCTQTVQSSLVLAFAMNTTSTGVKIMYPSDIYENMGSFPVVSMPATPLSLVNSNPYTPLQQISKLELNQKVQLILDLIVKFRTYTQFVDHHTFWELDEDTYLISFDDAHLFLAKCTIRQAIILTNKQVPIMTVLTKYITDQNKALFRLGQIIAKYADLSPCIFQVQRNELCDYESSYSAVHLQILTLKFLMEQAPLLPKTTLDKIKIDYEVACSMNVDQYLCDQPLNPKVAIYLLFLRDY